VTRAGWLAGWLRVTDCRCRLQGVVEKLLNVAASVRSNADGVLGSTINLSTRQLIRIAKRMEAFGKHETLAEGIYRSCLAQFLPPLAKDSLDRLLLDNGIATASAAERLAVEEDLVIETVEVGGGRQQLSIGGVTADILTDAESNALLVPDVVYFDNPQHTAVMRDILKDLELGEHLLLVGNQGVGKNKICDRLLHLLNRPREYIQLHRDTTIQTLTQQPSIEGGQIVYHPSPLVRAVENGTVLVIDEADKAPTHVTSVLKNLVESGDMMLADGRRIVPAGSPLAVAARSNGGVATTGETLLECHPDFQMVVLANRPGFPFLGSDFFGSMGDVFGCHAVVNPGMAAELSMLAKYGPTIDKQTLKKLAMSFSELRRLSNEGALAYPYSMRELVHIVSHLEKYPDEGLSDVINNVFDFDSYDPAVQQTVVDAFHKHGVPLGTATTEVNQAPV
jgi:energy-coupling factor transporter ATP-binding protein EcfA2